MISLWLELRDSMNLSGVGICSDLVVPIQTEEEIYLVNYPITTIMKGLRPGADGNQPTMIEINTNSSTIVVERYLYFSIWNPPSITSLKIFGYRRLGINT